MSGKACGKNLLIGDHPYLPNLSTLSGIMGEGLIWQEQEKSCNKKEINNRPILQGQSWRRCQGKYDPTHESS